MGVMLLEIFMQRLGLAVKICVLIVFIHDVEQQKKWKFFSTFSKFFLFFPNTYGKKNSIIHPQNFRNILQKQKVTF